MVIKETRSDKIFNFFNYLILGAIFVVCLYPLWFIIIASISDPNLVNSGQVWFWPKSVSLDGYKNLLADDSVLRGYLNTLIYTVGGTLWLLRCPRRMRFPARILWAASFLR